MKKFNLKSLSVDTKKEVDGVWHEVDCGFQVKVARLNNPKYVKTFQALAKPYRRLAEAGTLSQEKQSALAAEAISKTILLDWKELYIDGEKVPYSQAKAKEILADPQFSDFFALIMQFSQDAATFRQQEIEDEMGEPQVFSAGN